MNIHKLEQIVNSYYNGQSTQMVNQIKNYGQKDFVLDFYEYVKFGDYPLSNDLYATIVYQFFLLKDR